VLSPEFVGSIDFLFSLTFTTKTKPNQELSQKLAPSSSLHSAELSPTQSPAENQPPAASDSPEFQSDESYSGYYVSLSKYFHFIVGRHLLVLANGFCVLFDRYAFSDLRRFRRNTLRRFEFLGSNKLFLIFVY